MIYQYMIPHAPVTKKNHQQICVNRKTGQRFVRQSEQYNDFELFASYFLAPKPPKPIDYPVTVRCIYYMPTRRRVDASNLNAAVHDILVKYAVLRDDNRDIIASTDGTRVFYDKNNPRVEIKISPFTEAYEQWGGDKNSVQTDRKTKRKTQKGHD